MILNHNCVVDFFDRVTLDVLIVWNGMKLESKLQLCHDSISLLYSWVYQNNSDSGPAWEMNSHTVLVTPFI